MNITHPIYGTIEFNDVLSELINTSEVNRLKRIIQLGLVSLVFPGAVHNRFLHAIGVCHFAGKIADHLDLPQEEKDLIQAAALLHDVGHGPYSHTLETLIPKNQRHEIKAKDIITGKIKMDIPGAGRIPKILDKYKLDKKIIAELITGCHKTKPYLQQIINGPIDADKMDYLLLDSHFTGAKIGIIDVDRLMDVMVLENNKIKFLEKGKPVIKAIRTARSNMFAEVYIHHTARIADRMLLKAVKLSLPNLPNFYEYDDFKLLTKLEESPIPKSRELVRRISYNVSPDGLSNGVRNLYKAVFQIKTEDFSRKKAALVKKLKKVGTKKIESLLCKKLNLESGDIIVDFPDIFPQYSEKEFKELNISFQPSKGKSNYTAFSVYCSKENAYSVARTTAAFISLAKKPHLTSSWINKF
ncbi:HD domain-containing protein [Candidatus Woesearchaeota archaeon]|nr:HD domain-containing protein [Candidatus Woesearchaeota archaeon]